MEENVKYCFDPNQISLEQLAERIKSCDLVPSRQSLLEGLDEKIAILENQGLTNLAILRKELKDNARLFTIADRTGIDRDYLALLRREAESYFPKPFALKEFNWFPPETIEKLEAAGVQTTADVFEKPEEMRASGLDAAIQDNLLRCADLTRIQWINPTAALMLLDAGYDSPSKTASADADSLCAALMENNKDARYFKGNIGLRDIKRLIHAARYVQEWY